MVDRRRNEKGVALVFTLFLMASLSALAVSLMFLSQTETSSTRNYKTMSQARYAGEAGVHKTINYMINSYVSPDVPDFPNYNLTASPVTCTSAPSDCATTGPVILSSFASGSGYPTTNYPDSTVATAFAAAVQGTLATNVGGVLNNAAVGTVTYGAYARLLSMREVNVYGGGVEFVQTWEITSVGTVPGLLPATVEVTAMLERDLVEAETFAVFATSDICGAVKYSGGTPSGTDSYDSTNMTLAGSPPKPQTISSGGAIGTNGNLDLSGSVTINGTLSTPRSGVGACSGASPTAMTGTPASVTGGLIKLPQAKVYPTPVIPPSGTVGVDDWDINPGMTLTECQDKMMEKGWSCFMAGNDVTISPIVPGTPLPLGNVTLNANMDLIIGGTGTVKLNFNSFVVAGSTTLSMTNALTELNLTGTGIVSPAPVMDFQGNFSTTAWDPSKFQILYAGTELIKLRGNNDLAATIYAPEAHVNLASSYDVWGSILAKTYENSGGAKVHYDRSLGGKYKTLGNRVMSSFSWKKY
jgi:Tfp pilus assembly protein PilX